MTMKNVCEREYEFALILCGVEELTTEVEDALYEAGCDDATISVQYGSLFLEFARSAPSMVDAILSAIRDVKKANVGAEVVRVDECNLVNQAEIARRMDRSRQLVHQYIIGVRGPGGFPAPACQIADECPLWYWCEVSYWLWQHDMITQQSMLEAQEVAAINNYLEMERQRRIDSKLVDRIAAGVAATK